LLEREAETDAARPRAVDLEGNDDGESFWPCLAVRRAAYERVGGFAGTAAPGRAEKATFIDARDVVDEPTALVLMVPEGASALAAA
ncbi:MAG TPA: hypothetical protein VI111_07535, partial [Thermoleophilaceae bacterium]